MARVKTPKLKVFQAQFGFYDSVVAVSSQAAALRAWGTHQNLFADGQAGVTTDEAAVKAALAHPETPLRRALGTNGPFEVEPTSVTTVPDPPKRTSKRAAAKPKTKESPKPRADRSLLDAAERAVAEVDKGHGLEEDAFRERQRALDEEIAEAQRLFQKRREAAVDAVAAARKVYRKAGGSA